MLSLARFGLWLVSLLYGLVVRLRLLGYRVGVLPRHAVGAPVICIGNLTTGGTGKSPMVVLVAKLIAARGLKVGVLSRGYRAEPGQPNDEAKMLARLLPDVPHIQNPDRLAGARELQRQGVQVIVMDDGFSHLRLKRELDVVLVDATEPWGYGFMLPRGLLREPLSSTKRAGFAVITRSDSASAEQLKAISERLSQLGLPPLQQAQAKHLPVSLRALSDDAEVGLDWLANRKLLAVCGIANPEAFSATLAGAGAHVVELKGLSDHFAYDPGWLKEHWGAIVDRAVSLGAEAIVVTQKDAVKLRGQKLPKSADAGLPVLELAVEMQLEAEGLARLTSKLLSAAGIDEAEPIANDQS